MEIYAQVRGEIQADSLQVDLHLASTCVKPNTVIIIDNNETTKVKETRPTQGNSCGRSGRDSCTKTECKPTCNGRTD